MNIQTWTKTTFEFDPAAPPVYVKNAAGAVTPGVYYAVSRVEGSPRYWQTWIQGECLTLHARTMTEARRVAETHEGQQVHGAAIAANEAVDRATLEADVEYAAAANATADRWAATDATDDVLANAEREAADEIAAAHRDALDEDLTWYIEAGGSLEFWTAERAEANRRARDADHAEARSEFAMLFPVVCMVCGERFATVAASTAHHDLSGENNDTDRGPIDRAAILAKRIDSLMNSGAVADETEALGGRWAGMLSGVESGVYSYDPASDEFRQHAL
jgi:hypothetical protein